MILRIGRRYSIAVADLAEASRAYQAARNASGEGASTFPTGRLDVGRWNGKRTVYHVSYNGRIWTPPTRHGKQIMIAEAAK